MGGEEPVTHGQSSGVFQHSLIAGKLSKQFLQMLAAVIVAVFRACFKWSLHACFF